MIQPNGKENQMSQDLAVPTDLNVGMEEFTESDLVMPRIDIVSKEGRFRDSLSGEEFESFQGVILGLIKGRVLFDADVEDKVPYCKSVNFEVGMPRRAAFPWKASGFDPATTPDGSALPCEDCKLQEWGSHPKNDSPWCSETWTFALMQIIEGVGYTPAIMTVQRTGLKPAKAYLTSYARSKSPTFMNTTTFKLDKQSRGSNVYSVPRFVRGEATDPNDFQMFAQTYLRIADLVRTPRDAEAEAEIGEPPAQTTQPAPTPPQPTTTPEPAPAATTAPAAAPAATSDADDDDSLPF